MLLIRYAVVCPTITAGLAFTYVSPFQAFHVNQPSRFVMLVGSLGHSGHGIFLSDACL